jgi:Peptidase family M23
MSRHRTTAAILFVLLATWASSATAGAAVPNFVFPVVAKTTYTNDFGDPRWQGRHEGNDLMAAKRSPVVAVEAGRVVKWTTSRAAGCMLYLHGRSGTTYMYVHLNNDRTRRNDNRGGCRNGIAYAPGLARSQLVQAGQLIGYVGDSGDADGIASHLHFEVHPNGGRAVSPYLRLRAARHLLFPRPPAAVRDISLRIGGTVVLTRRNPERIRISAALVRLSNAWMIRPARNVTLSLPSTAVVRRGTASGPSTAATLADFKPGQRVTAWTNVFTHNITTAKADPPLLTIRDLLLWTR